MKMFYLLMALCSFSISASELDKKLDTYIKNFNLRPISKPGALNKNLFVLGRDLYFEKKISGNKNISCADCHHPMTMTNDGLPLGIGEGAEGIETSKGGRQQKVGVILARNTPAVFNLHNVPVMFWDGRVQFDSETGRFFTPAALPEEFKLVLDTALSAQALFPMVNHEEMRGQKGTNEIADAANEKAAWEAIFSRIINDPKYKSRLEEIFPGEKLNLAHIAKAIGHFEAQAFYSGDTGFDRYLKGDKAAMTEIQKIGMDVFFGKGKCGECHKGEHLSDFSYQNIGVPQIGPGTMNGDDFGRLMIDRSQENLYAFRVPPLRNIGLTAPYMHNGSFKTLAQVIEHYDDVKASLEEFTLVNNYKNYVEKLAGPLKSTNELKLANLSSKLTPKLFFEESEEKALAEFLRGALTEKRFLEAEISADYSSGLRIQLSEEGFNKIVSNLPSHANLQKTNYFYFDVLNDEGYALRELEKPVKMFLTETDGQMKLFFRQQLFKSSSAVAGVIAAGTFEDEEVIGIGSLESRKMAELNNDFFNRLYTYNNEMGTRPIPTIEAQVMKEDVLSMNEMWHTLNFNRLEMMSDELNISKDELFFAPTSSNSKIEYSWAQNIEGHEFLAVLQKSFIRTENGGVVTTWAIELRTGKIAKKTLTQILNKWLEELVNYGLDPKDAQGSSPSPSKLTERVLQEIL